MGTNALARLLQPPVTARWQDIGRVWADERTGELLVTLQSLTTLHLNYDEHTTHVDFLPQLPLLTALRLAGYDYQNNFAWCIPAGAMLSSLVRCTSLTELDLHSGFNSAHWSALFAKLPLKKLTIRGGLETLRCFASGPITDSLEELTLQFLDLPPSELPHLYPLRRLRSLQLQYCFSAHLPDAALNSLSPPSPILPALTLFIQQQREQVKRQGPSFEWMQRQLTH